LQLEPLETPKRGNCGHIIFGDAAPAHAERAQL
jgi:hypothetical protein